MIKKILLASSVSLAGLFMASGSFAAVNAVTPSTNDTNRTNEWAYVDQISQGVGTTDLQFISTRTFPSCFEYRADGDTTQKTSVTNYNPSVTDGLYPFVCVNNSTATRTITANQYVEVRMVFGAENDERFDWTRFDVTPAQVEPTTTPVPTTTTTEVNPDKCPNNDLKFQGIQTVIPEGVTIDANGNCVDNNTNTSTAVLAATTSSPAVLGAVPSLPATGPSDFLLLLSSTSLFGGLALKLGLTNKSLQKKLKSL